jgi:hypothetical protein
MLRPVILRQRFRLINMDRIASIRRRVQRHVPWTSKGSWRSLEQEG